MIRLILCAQCYPCNVECLFFFSKKLIFIFYKTTTAITEYAPIENELQQPFTTHWIRPAWSSTDLHVFQTQEQHHHQVIHKTKKKTTHRHLRWCIQPYHRCTSSNGGGSHSLVCSRRSLVCAMWTPHW